MLDPPVSGQAEVPHSQGPEGAPKPSKLGPEDASTIVGGESTVGLLPAGGRIVAKGVEVPHTKGWAPWPTGLHATEEEKRKKEEEKKKEEEQKKKEEERRTEEEDGGGGEGCERGSIPTVRIARGRGA